MGAHFFLEFNGSLLLALSLSLYLSRSLVILFHRAPLHSSDRRSGIQEVNTQRWIVRERGGRTRAARAHLESGFNDVGGRNERSGGHAGDGTGQQQRKGRVVAALVGQRRFAVRVRREVDGAERDVAQEARFGTL